MNAERNQTAGDVMLTIEEVSQMVGLKRSAIYIRVRAGIMPSPVRLSRKCSRWMQSDIQKWMATQSSAVSSEDESRLREAILPASTRATSPVTTAALRDHFAGLALLAILSTSDSWRDNGFKPVDGMSNMENNALCAYAQADAMLKARSL